MILMNLDEKSRVPKYRQIIEEFRRKIESRVVLPGERLPSTRRLADHLDVHRSTVALAYQELWALGFLDLRPGARPRVRGRLPVAGKIDRAAKGLIDWEAAATEASGSVLRAFRRQRRRPGVGSDSIINFRSLDMDRRVFPLESFRSCLSRVTKREGLELLGYGDPQGYRPLREYVSRRLQGHDICADPDEILLTSGSQQAIDLVFRMVAESGRAVAIESPTYSHMLPLLRLSGLRPLEIPVRRDGMDLSALEEALEEEKPALVYTMPTFHNPTGVSTDQAHRERLLSLCRRRRVPILEDGFEEEMKYFGKAVLPIKSMDRDNVVIYCGTFSKVLFPGVRIGWVAAERECIERLTAIRGFTELSSSMVLQAAVCEFCRNGFYDRHVGRMHRLFRKRMQTALRALDKHIRSGWAEWEKPNGGFLIWLRLRTAVPEEIELERLLASFGVEVAFGSGFYFSEPADNYIRLSISTLDEQEISEGVRRLSRALARAASA